MKASLRVAWARLRGFLRPESAKAEFDEEIEAHLSMAIEDKMRQGLSPREARRRARLELGNLTRLRDAAHDARGLPFLTSSWLDIKLGLRRLRSAWGLTLVAGLAMTVAIGLAVVAFEVLDTFGATDLPLDEGDRVVALQAWDLGAGRGLEASVRDFDHWRRAARSFEAVGAFREVERNLQAPAEIRAPAGAERAGVAVPIAEITASGLALARVSPRLGRMLEPADELASAEPVLVIGHEAWTQRFAADPEIVGRRVFLDGTLHTIVGVMPEGFGFPVADRYWTPLRVSPSTVAASTQAASADRADLVVFARLRDGASIETAQAELRRIGQAPTVDAATEGVELRVVPYAVAFSGGVDRWTRSLLVFLATLLLVPPCVNVAILVYARTVTRQGEFAARYVLGARRSSIVAQLFVEILVLAVGAGALALGAASWIVAQILDDLRERGEAIPFWMDFQLSWTTVAFVAGLAIFAATLAGAVPALRATGGGMAAGLRSLNGPKPASLGGVWTALIVVQVAFSFALLPWAVEMTWGTVRTGLLGPGFVAEEYLTARLEMRADEVPATSRFADRQVELVRALTAEPEVRAVTLSASLPGDEPWVGLEAEPVSADRVAADRVAAESAEASETLERIGGVVRVNQVDSAFFEVFELPILAGRGFEAAEFQQAEFQQASRAVIVNRTFATKTFGDADPLRRRVRYRGDEGDWFEIVGVTADLERYAGDPTVYHPALLGSLPVVHAAARIRADPTVAADTLRAVAWTVDPTLRVTEIRSLDAIYRQQAVGNYLGAAALVAATLAVLLLSAAGIYAMMSFTAARRRHEIGIRLALGASTAQLLSSIFGRALGQVGLGALVGTSVALFVGYTIPVEAFGGWEVRGVIPAAVAFIGLVAALALVGPARRVSRVQPTEELREG